MATGYLDETPLKQERLNPYVSQYVPIPLDIMFKEGQVVQKRGDANLEKLDKELEALQKIKVRPVDEPLRNQIIGEYIEARDAMVNGDVNPASYDFRRQATNMVNQFANRSDLKDLTNLYGLYDQRQKIQQALNQRGKRTLDFNNPLTSQAYDPTTGLGAFNMERLGVEELMDRHGEMEKYYNQMTADGSTGALLRNMNNPLFMDRTTWNGITQSKVGKVAQAAMNSYLNTDVGAQQLEDYMKLQGMTDDEAKKAIFSEMLGVGQERVFSKSQTQTIQDPGAMDMFKRKRDIAQAAIPNMYVQKLKAASSGDGAHMNPEDWGNMMGFTKSKNKVLENQFGTTYNVNLNDQNAVFAVKKGGRQFDQATWDIAHQLTKLYAEKYGIEADIEDMSTSDGVWDSLGDGFTLFGKSLTGYGNGWAGNKEGKGFYFQGKRKELQPIIDKIEELRKTNPAAVASYLANIQYFTGEEGFRDMIAAKVLTSGGNMDVRITPSGNNMQTLNGHVYYNVEGLGTENQMRARFGDLQYQALVDGGYLKEMEGDDDETYVSIPNIHLKDDLTLAKGNKYNSNYYDGTQSDLTEANWNMSTAGYFHDQANISRGKDILMQAIDLNRNGDNTQLTKYIQTQITNQPNLSGEQKKKLKAKITEIGNLRQNGFMMKSEAAYRDMLNDYFSYMNIEQKTAEEYTEDAVDEQTNALEY